MKKKKLVLSITANSVKEILEALIEVHDNIKKMNADKRNNCLNALGYDSNGTMYDYDVYNE